MSVYRTIGPLVLEVVLVPYLFQANIHSIMGSEDQVLNLMRLLDDGIQQAEVIENKLDSYDKILQVSLITGSH